MDRQVDIGFVKDEPLFHELQSVEVHADVMVCIAAATHPLAAKRFGERAATSPASSSSSTTCAARPPR